MKKFIGICVVLLLAAAILFAHISSRSSYGHLQTSEEMQYNTHSTAITIEDKGLSDEEKAISLSDSLYIHLDPKVELHRQLIDRFDDIIILPGDWEEWGKWPGADYPDRSVRIYTANVPETVNGKMSYTLVVIKGLVPGSDEHLLITEYSWHNLPLARWPGRISVEAPPGMLTRMGGERFNHLALFTARENEDVWETRQLEDLEFEGTATAKVPMPLKWGIKNYVAQYWLGFTPGEDKKGLIAATHTWFSHWGSPKQGGRFLWIIGMELPG